MWRESEIFRIQSFVPTKEKGRNNFDQAYGKNNFLKHTAIRSISEVSIKAHVPWKHDMNDVTIQRNPRAVLLFD